MNIYGDFKYTKLNFGKFKGYFMKDIPDEYIEWAIKNIKDEASATMFAAEYMRRHKDFR
jgi:hypothetical protein